MCLPLSILVCWSNTNLNASWQSLLLFDTRVPVPDVLSIPFQILFAVKAVAFLSAHAQALPVTVEVTSTPMPY